MLAAEGKSEFGLYGGVGGMTVMAILTFIILQDRGEIAAVEDWGMGFVNREGPMPLEAL